MSGLEASRDMDLHLKTPRVPRRLAILRLWRYCLRKPPTLPFPFECSRTFYSFGIEEEKRFLVSSSNWWWTIFNRPQVFFGRWTDGRAAGKTYAVGRQSKMHSRSSKKLLTWELVPWEEESILKSSQTVVFFLYFKTCCIKKHIWKLKRNN